MLGSLVRIIGTGAGVEMGQLNGFRSTPKARVPTFRDWSTKNLKMTYCRSYERLAAEMLQFVEFLEPTEEEDEARAQLSDIICQHIKFCWPDSEVTVYGSCKTRLLLPTSDVDLSVTPNEPVEPSYCVRKLGKRLEKKHVYTYDQMQRVRFAKVPVLIIKDERLNMSVDVTFNNVSPSSARTVLWLEMYPALKTIYLVSRYVLQTVRFEARPRLTITVPNRGGLASYSLVCLIAHFMQYETHRVSVQPDAPGYTAYLLVEMLRFYADFDYRHIGLTFSNDHGYFSKDTVDKRFLMIERKLTIEDPDMPGENVARATSLFAEVQNVFAWMAYALKQKVQFSDEQTSILGGIIPGAAALYGNTRCGLGFRGEPIVLGSNEQGYLSIRYVSPPLWQPKRKRKWDDREDHHDGDHRDESPQKRRHEEYHERREYHDERR